MTAKPASASSRPTARAASYMGSGSRMRAEPNTVMASGISASASNPSTNSDMIRMTRHGSVWTKDPSRRPRRAASSVTRGGVRTVMRPRRSRGVAARVPRPDEVGRSGSLRDARFGPIRTKGRVRRRSHGAGVAALAVVPGGHQPRVEHAAGRRAGPAPGPAPGRRESTPRRRCRRGPASSRAARLALRPRRTARHGPRRARPSRPGPRRGRCSRHPDPATRTPASARAPGPTPRPFRPRSAPPG